MEKHFEKATKNQHRGKVGSIRKSGSFFASEPLGGDSHGRAVSRAETKQHNARAHGQSGSSPHWPAGSLPKYPARTHFH